KLFNEIETVTRHSISDFLLDEEASIPKGQLLAIGSLMVVLSCVLGVQDASAWHSSHSSALHSSHSNFGYPRHSSHSSHSSHASHASHSNSLSSW
ncbi:MAG: hypothetical protein IJG34_11355, partial [Synergistaceae bacterium]|nr:hypothetical protein [Synergistaceae bacterium]